MDFSKNIPRYHVTRDNLTRLVLLTALFSLVFINIFEPYNSRHWLSDMSDTKYFLLSLLLTLIGMLVVSASRLLLYNHCKKQGRTIELWKYLAWIAAEITCISVAFTILEILWFADKRSVGQLLRASIGNTTLILLLPYSVIWLYFSWRDKDRRLRAIEQYRTNKNVGSLADLSVDMGEKVKFFDGRGDVCFSVRSADIAYIKGADNYVTIYYLDGQKLGTYTIRRTFKKLQEEIKSEDIVRCHKSYMVNKLHIKVLEKSGDGYVVRLDLPGVERPTIPVSKKYISNAYELLG